MSLRKNWFYYFSISLAIFGLLYILVCGFLTLGEGQEYPYLAKGILLGAIFTVWMTVSIVTSLVARIRNRSSIRFHTKRMRQLEIIIVLLALGAAIAVRLWVIFMLPMEPASDYKTYYEIAKLLQAGTLSQDGKGYMDYISMFPHVMGYSYILKLWFSVAGASVLAGQYLNVFFSVMTVFFTYRIARKLGGRIAGMVVLLFSAFWPSQVLYITMLSAEYSFSFFLFLCIWIFISLMKDYDATTNKAGTAIVLHMILGILLALTAAIRPMAMILLVAIVICMLPQKMKLEPVHRNNIALRLRMLEKGWIRCGFIILPYLLVSNIITTNIELTIDKTLPSAMTSFGYNLLVGLNEDSIGGWNEGDAALLYDTLEETNSATLAHIACRDLAIQRLMDDPKGILNLFLQKYELLWGNDDYGATWNITFLQEQGNLTQERSDFLYSLRDINDILYMIVVFMALISLIYLWKKKGNLAYVLALLYLGTAGMHLFVESQNRYHYFVLQAFMVFAGMSVSFLYEDAKSMVYQKSGVRLIKQNEEKMMQQAIEEYQMQEDRMEELRKEAYENVFDMKTALENGNVIMTVSKAYQTDLLENEKTIDLEVAVTKQ